MGTIARRGFRRPPTEKEMNRLLAFIDEAQKEGDSFEQGVRIALQAVLVSPQFLFRIERDPDPERRQDRARDQRFRAGIPFVLFPLEQHARRRIACRC